jgi:ferredoxin hydrogenase large subunit/hydrogenase large subunit
MKKITIDPITRIEGHLAVHVEVESGRVSDAFCKGEMFRGFEAILKGRNPLDAQQITQRICGVCPVSHGIASVLAQDAAYGATPPENGRLGRNLIQAANYIQSHILHFYHLAALDFVDITAIAGYQGKDRPLLDLKAWVQSQLSSGALYPAAPFLPRYSGRYIESVEMSTAAVKHYLDALNMRTLAHKMGTIFGGKMPHVAALVPGGITERISTDKIAAYRSMLKKLQSFINDAYLPDVIGVAKAFPDYMHQGKGCSNFLSYGVFPSVPDGKKLLPAGVIIEGKPAELDAEKITEHIGYSFYSSRSGLHPSKGETQPDPQKTEAYSWIKAPRYDGKAVEVGPLARILVAYHRGEDPKIKGMVDQLLEKLGKSPEELTSVMGRHAARALECKIIADECAEWLEQLKPGEPAFRDFEIPEAGSGVGLTEAPRGALGHWISIREGKIEKYQCVVPTTWNCSPRDDAGNPGPMEQALLGTSIADSDNPIEATRVVRSFDPCIACAVH